MNLLISLILTSCIAFAGQTKPKLISSSPLYQNYANQLVEKEGINRTFVDKEIGQLEVDENVLYKIKHPAEAKTWQWYKSYLLTKKRIKLGQEFALKHKNALRRAEKLTGVPKEYIISILGVESNYGEFVGSFNVARSLATIGMFYPSRADFFQFELTTLIKQHQAKALDMHKLVGSYAGAFGMSQFMPDSYNDYAISDSRQAPDLQNNFTDNILSIANFLKKKGSWESGQFLIPVIFSQKALSKHLKQNEVLWISRKDPAFKDVTANRQVNKKATGILLAKENKRKISAWLTFNNFHAVKTYNQSNYYALLIHLLAQKIKHG